MSCVYCNYYPVLLGHSGLHSYHSQPAEVHKTSTTVPGEMCVCVSLSELCVRSQFCVL